jgi:hypothetical protein
LIDGRRPAEIDDVDINRTPQTEKDRPMFTDFRYAPASIHQQELRAEAATQRLIRQEPTAGPARPATLGQRVSRLFRRLAGPTPA